MRRVVRVSAWQWRQPTLIRWLEAGALFGIALAIRFSVRCSGQSRS